MNRSTSLLLGLLALIARPAVAEERPIKLSEVPSAVVEAVRQRHPKSKLRSAERSEDAGKITFEVRLIEGPRTLEVELASDGTVLVEEEALAVGELPAAVKQALSTSPKYARWRLEKAERIVTLAEPDHLRFEVLASAKGKRMEVILDAGGQIEKEEDVTQEKE